MMNNSNRNLGFYLVRLFILSVLGTVTAQYAGVLLINFKYGLQDISGLLELTKKVPEAWDTVRIIQLIHSCLSFLLPAVIVWKIFSGKFSMAFPKAQRSTLIVFAVVPILLFLFFPLAQSFYVFNQNIQFFEPLHSIMQNTEQQMNATILGMLSDHSVRAVFFNFIVIAIAAAIIEEVFFRGVLQRILMHYIDPHVAIFIAAFIFSTVHFQFFGLLPRLALGIFFGYLFWHTRRLTIPIFTHALFNGTQLAAFYLMPESAGNMQTAEQASVPVSVTITSTFLFFSLYFVLYQSLIKKTFEVHDTK